MEKKYEEKWNKGRERESDREGAEEGAGREGYHLVNADIPRQTD